MAIYYWARGLSLGVACIPCETLLEKSNFSFTRCCQLKMASGLGMGVCIHLFFPALGPPPVLDGPVHAASVSGFVCVSVLLCLEGLISVEPSITTDLYNLSTFLLPQCSLSSERRNLMETSHLRLNVSRSLSTHCPVECLCIHSRLLQNTSLMIAEQDTAL